MLGRQFIADDSTKPDKAQLTGRDQKTCPDLMTGVYRWTTSLRVSGQWMDLPVDIRKI